MNQEINNKKLRVLFRGWTAIPHSYAMVNCFQLLHLHKYFGDKVQIYVEEMEYYRKEWNTAKKWVYGEVYNQILQGLKKWSGEEIDVVYSITYPYNVSEVKINGKKVPKCVFYTSEFAWLNNEYFTLGESNFSDNDQVTCHLQKNPEIYFTAPSVWSGQGISKYNISDVRNRVITHGVDPSIFYLQANRSQRKAVREFYKVKETDILLINIGAMTGNKGMMLILQALHELVNKRNHREFKLLLKGTGDLYNSKQFLESYFEQLQRESVLSKADTDNLLENQIIFSDKTLSYSRINDLFNAADLYISPYLAEGFNLTVLESLAAGLPVLVPETGSTREYINDISNSGLDTSKYVIKLRSQVGKHPSGMLQNVIELSDLIHTLINNRSNIQNMKEQRYTNYYDLQRYISTHYSWRRVVELLYEYLCSILNTCSQS
uniref:Glycosyl transferase family 1 domain-containing protein n=1 Tax=viral metagenome TaxID=1070528 RepID=A0A6C0H6B0_9ZZZZ